MSTIVVDYENINHLALLEVDLLKPTDTLEIFYSEACKSIKSNLFNKIKYSGCQLKLTKIKTKGSNHLDFYIATRIGMIYENGEKEIAILSNDKDFNPVVEYINSISNGKTKIIKSDNISTCLASFSKETDKDRRRLIQDSIKPIDFEEINEKLLAEPTLEEAIAKKIEKTNIAFEKNRIVECVKSCKGTDMHKTYCHFLTVFGAARGYAYYKYLKETITPFIKK